MKLKSTTIRDFGGGWNVADSDMNLSSRFQPVSDNVDRGIDGSIGPRMGYSLVADFGRGQISDSMSITWRVTVANGKASVIIEYPTDDLTDGGHVTITAFGSDVGGITANKFIGTFGIKIIDATHFTFDVRALATSDIAGELISVTYTYDNYLLGGNIIHQRYFNGRLVVFTDIGEVGTMDADYNVTAIWNKKIVYGIDTELVVTRDCRHWSSSTFKSTIIACNGYDKDKPLQIKNDFTVEYLVDKSSLSNSAVPRADFVVCLQKYVVFVRTEYGDAFIECSAKGTDGTFTRDSNPEDSVEVDLSQETDSVAPVLLGATQFRDKLYVSFYDKGMVGTLGIYPDEAVHEPDFSDTVSEHGTVAHQTMVSLGNDIFMCDYAGVPSLTISQASSMFVPVRVSELIAPSLQRHLSNLSEDSLRYKSFAVYNRSNKSYMLFVPKYDEGVIKELPSDPIIYNKKLRERGWAYIYAPNHGLIEGSKIVIAGTTSFADVSAGDINGTRDVISIVDKDGFIVQVDKAPSNTEINNGGGSNMTFSPINDETIGYVFEYNKEFKIRRWTRYRNWNFDCGAISQRGKMFFAKGLKVFRMGDNEEPIYSDGLNYYDRYQWELYTEYPLGTRVRDQVTDEIYISNVNVDVASSGTFADYRENNPDDWSLYVGEPIHWVVDSPWSDMQDRARNKVNVYVSLESEGRDRFTVSAFTNNIMRDPADNSFIPLRSLEFVAGNSGGWNMNDLNTWGGGRSTRQEKVWPFALRGKLIKWRIEGRTTKRVKLISLSMYYKIGGIR